MVFRQTHIRLRPRARGFHLVTEEVLAGLPALHDIRAGFLQLFLQHTSASLTINENADPDVRRDMETWVRRAVPDAAPDFVHTAEGDDDMSAHVKSSLLGVSLLIPITNGRLGFGTWQGVYLGEHRDNGGSRHVLATAWGQD